MPRRKGVVDAIASISEMRQEVVGRMGICGRGTHQLTELLDALDGDKIDPDEALRQAAAVPEGTTDFR